MNEAKIDFVTTWSKGNRVLFRVRRILTALNEWKIFESLPLYHTFQDELGLLAYVLVSVPGTTMLAKLKTRELADAYIKSRGWKKRKHLRLVEREQIANPGVIVIDEKLNTRGLKVGKKFSLLNLNF